jgi:hypothetical protein
MARGKEAVMTPNTTYLTRLVGLFLLILAVAELSQPATLAKTEIAMVSQPALLLVVGLITLLAGLALVLAHNIWSGGPAAILVTVLGWMLLFKGAALVILPSSTWEAIVEASGFPTHYSLYSIPSLLLGAYLTRAGFSARSIGNS